jgi:UDP-glucose:(heptosyl)LPS alpha-1,3-glucosyltransferase
MLPRFSRYGGVEQFGFRLAGALAARGHQVDFICARQEVDPPDGVSVLRTGRPRGPRWLKMLVFARGAESLLRAGRYDCAVSLGKTLSQDILRVGGGPLPQFWRYSEKSYAEGPSRYWKQLTRRLNPANLLARCLENRQFAGAGSIVAVSHFVRDLILEAAPGLAPETVTVIYNRPDLARFSPPTAEERAKARQRFGIAGETVAIGLAASNFQLKGTAPLIRALARLPERCALYVAGDRNHAAYTALADSLGLGERVHFLGKLDAMPEWYKALDVFALPSFYDACSNAVLEALASGLPTLSSSSNGSSYFLPPENVVTDPGDSDELARVLARLVSQAEEQAKSGARTPFTWPEDLPSGPEAFVSLVETYLGTR